MYNFNVFSGELFSFIKSDLNTYHEIDILSVFTEDSKDVELEKKRN